MTLTPVPGVGPELDAARARVVASGLVSAAIAQLTPVVIGLGLSLEALGPVKQLQKRFFSEVAWTRDDDDALAAAIGPGVDGMARYELAPGLSLVWGWDRGRFLLRVTSDEPFVRPVGGDASGIDRDLLFDGPVVPEVTPSPRTIRFATPPLHCGPGRAFDAATAGADPRVARIFDAFDAVTNILVGPDFVAVTISRPDGWEALLGPMLRTITEEFASHHGDDPTAPEAPSDLSSLGVGAGARQERRDRPPRGLERAWADLGALRADNPDDLERVVAATRDREPARRQVAAVLLADAPPAVAARTWARLLASIHRRAATERSRVSAEGAS